MCSAVTATGARREARTRGSCKRSRNFMAMFGDGSDQVERRRLRRIGNIGDCGGGQDWAVAGLSEASSSC